MGHGRCISFRRSEERSERMAASPMTHEEDPSEAPASVRVESFLECVETKRRRTLRVRVAAVSVGALIAAVAFLTSIGVVLPDTGRVVASAGALVAGLLVRDP
jgi:hypothetical protein